MSKGKCSNVKVVIPIASIVVAALTIGSYFIGYNVAKSETANPAGSSQSAKVVGVYKRSYYNNYNKSVDSFAIFREDSTCRYIESIATEYSAKLDFEDRSQQDCKYTYDNGTNGGKIEITYDFMTDGKPDPHTETINFTYKNGGIMIGGASYSKI